MQLTTNIKENQYLKLNKKNKPRYYEHKANTKKKRKKTLIS